MSNEEIKPGDVVELKSGSLKMTVSHSASGGFLCVWFSGTENKQAVFKKEVLKRVGI